MQKNINTLSELEKEQERLKIMMGVSQEAFVESLKVSGNEIKKGLVNKVITPSAVIGLGIATLKTISNNKNKNKYEGDLNNYQQLGAYNESSLLGSFTTKILEFVQGFFSKS